MFWVNATLIMKLCLYLWGLSGTQHEHLHIPTDDATLWCHWFVNDHMLVEWHMCLHMLCDIFNSVFHMLCPKPYLTLSNKKTHTAPWGQNFMTSPMDPLLDMSHIFKYRY